MIELELLGIGADSETLVFSDAHGERYCVPITDELRASVRRDRPKIEAITSTQRSLRPREIQALLRSGLSAEEIAAEHGMDVLYIQRFEAPVEAEKNYALNRALNFRIGGTADGPIMGELVVDRLAARGVSPRSLTWSARRDVDGPWEIVVTFVQGANEHSASWHVDTASAHLEAIDQEARWLTETVTAAPTQAIFTPATPTGEVATESEEELQARDALIDQLNAARGRRVEVEIDTEDTADEFAALFGEEAPPQPAPPPSISARIYSIAQSRTKTSIPALDSPEAPAKNPLSPRSSSGQEAVSSPSAEPTDAAPGAPTEAASEPATASASSDAATAHGADTRAQADVQDSLLPGMEGVEAQQPTGKKRRKRRSVPSWDEIVFGSKPQ
ncbi:septation protein SepH [Schaalia sp. Marseille-Q2122]|uniref:septation protein SepH n=1 Tax=Schaalia sp. Marseille-Q2122 TaxID=2736604 RepID=UPI00158A87FB|nr:septation protein SepH [Schaalia sp. Marseille-Q2122]